MRPRAKGPDGLIEASIAAQRTQYRAQVLRLESTVSRSGHGLKLIEKHFPRLSDTTVRAIMQLSCRPVGLLL